MDQIRESLNKLTELDDKQLEDLSDEIVKEFESVESETVSAEVVEQMTELATALESVKSELSNRAAQVQELSDMKEAAMQRVHGDSTDDEDDSDVVDADVPVDEVEAPVVVTDPSDDGSNDPSDDTSDDGSNDPSDNESDEVTPDDEEAEEDPDKKKKEAFSEKDSAETELAVETPEVKDKAVSEDTKELAVEESTKEAPEAVKENEDKELSADNSVEETQKESDQNNQVDTELTVQEASDDSSSEAEESARAEGTELTDRKESEAVTASVNEGSEDIQAPDAHRPVAEEVDTTPRASLTITAGGDIPGVTNGSELPDMDAVADAMSTRMHAIRRTSGGDGEQFSVATLNQTFPEDRTLRSGDSDGNMNKIKNVTSPQAIMAAGGFCAPVDTSYDLFGFGVADRPVKDSLASFSADRGGIRYTSGPRLGDLDGAVSVWTLEDDVAATGSNPATTKPCLRVECGEETLVVVDAIPMCLTFGNLQSRAFPELVKANNELAIITQARLGETRLLTRIGNLSTQVTAAKKLGAARDFFVQVDQAAAAYRSRHRLSPSESLRVIVPAWFKNMVRADITMSMPAGDDQARFGIADNIVDAWFNARHINVTWTLDGETGQIFGAQSAGALSDFPGTLIWYMFSEGTFLYLDGGTLDLGLVRDSSLNSVNDYKMFVETFEAVAKVGIESLRVTSTLDVNGAVSGTVDPSGL